MNSTTSTRLRTKQCLFCAETIQAAAIKCRYCGEFLNTKKARALAAGDETDAQTEAGSKQADSILFRGRPSVWGMAGSCVRGLVFLAVAGFLVYFPLEELFVVRQTEGPASVSYEGPSEELAGTEVAEGLGQDLAAAEPIETAVEEEAVFELTESQALVFAQYRITGAAGLGMLVIFILLLKMLRLKMIHYEVTGERIEWSRGIFDRRVDNLDMFRVVDLRLRRSLLDCIFGIGTVTLITTDKTDPEFTFEKIRRPRRLYDIIKKASLEADKQNTVVHLE